MTFGGGAPKVVAEACFSPNDSTCPGGFSAAPGSGEPCVGLSACGHGTHVAGIAAGVTHVQDVQSPAPGAGVAPGANLISIRVFGPNLSSGNFSDILTALDYVRVTLLPAFPTIDAVVVSAGGLSPTSCDAEFGKPVVDNLRSSQVATVAPAGFNGLHTTAPHIRWPACLDTAVAVGATNDQDMLVHGSNSTAEVDVLAPGVDVLSSVPGNGFALGTGTSAAAAHVAGAVAVLRATKPTASISAIESHLEGSGLPVQDPYNGIVKPRVRVLAASVRLADTGFKAGGSWTGPGVGVASGEVGLRPQKTAGSLTVSVPANASAKAAFLYWMTLGGPDNQVVMNGSTYTGTLQGASKTTTPDNVNQLGPNRLYRATVPVGNLLSGVNGTYLLSGVGGTGGARGQGVSLVVVYGVAGGQPGGVVLRHGAATATPNGAFADIIPVSPTTSATKVGLHMGIAGGSGVFTEGPVVFDSTNLTAANAINDPERWDALALPVPTTLPAGPQTHTVSLTTGSAGLAVGYVALSYGS